MTIDELKKDSWFARCVCESVRASLLNADGLLTESLSLGMRTPAF